MRNKKNKVLEEICIEMFNQGITQKDIMQRIVIKRSTLSDYYKSWKTTKEKNLKHFNSIDKARTRIDVIGEARTRIEGMLSSYIKEDITDNEWFYISRMLEKELKRLVNIELEKTNKKAKLLSHTNNQSSVKNYRPLVSHVDTDV